MKMLNQIAPTVIVSKDGNILLFNERFDFLVKDRLKLKSLPKNIFKFGQADTEYKNKLTEIVQKIISQKVTSNLHNEPIEFEFIMKK